MKERGGLGREEEENASEMGWDLTVSDSIELRDDRV